MAMLHLALGNPLMAEEFARLGRYAFGALRDPAIQWSLLMVGLIALIRLAWITFRRGRSPGLADVLRAVGLGTALILGTALLALVVALPFAVCPRLGLAGFEIHFVSVVLVAGFIAAVCLIYGNDILDSPKCGTIRVCKDLQNRRKHYSKRCGISPTWT